MSAPHAMAGAASGPQLQVEQVARVFAAPRGRGLIEALKPIDLAVARNDFITILGPSGCGKSTLLAVLALLLGLPLLAWWRRHATRAEVTAASEPAPADRPLDPVG